MLNRLNGLPARLYSIRAKLLLLRLGVGLLIGVSIGVLGYVLMAPQIRNHQIATLKADTVTTAILTKNLLDHTSGIVKRIATADAVNKYYKSYNGHALNRFFQNFANVFAAISYVDPNGREQVKMVQGKNEELLQDISRDSGFIRAAQSPNRIFLSAPRRVGYLDEPVLEFNYQYVNYFDERVGFIRAAIPLSRFRTALETVPSKPAEIILVTDAQGHVVYGSRPGLLATNIKGRMDSDSHFLTAAFLKRNLSGRHRFLGQDAFVSATTLPELGWKAFVAMPYAKFNAPLKALRDKIILVSLLVLTAGAMLSRLIGLNITTPVNLLTRTTTAIANGADLSKRVEWRSRDELGDLARSFNLMLDRLQNAAGALSEERHFSDNVIGSMADTLIVITPDAIIRKANRSAIELLGYTEDELVGHPIGMLMEDEEEELFQKLASQEFTEQERLSNLETEYIGKHGEKIPMSFSGSVVQDSSGDVMGMVLVGKDITERKRAEARLNYQASHDPLTGLPNRMLLLDRLQQAIAHVPWHDRLLGVLFLDLDRFKLVNDTLGHDIGDRLLTQVADRLSQSIRPGDTVARLGGDEFVIILDQVAVESDIIRAADKIIYAFGKPFLLNNREFFISTSMGISICPTDGDSAQRLLKHADIAMYHAKEQGRNNYRLYSTDLNTKVSERLELEIALRHALEHNEFQVHYQPQLDLGSGRILAVEALVRWQHPEQGMIPPGKFIPVAEDSGLMVRIDRLVLRTACAKAAAWQNAGLPLVVAVNVSGPQFWQPDLAEFVTEALAATGLAPNHLELELTEGILMRDTAKATTIMQVLKDVGVALSIDDFGTGYSSLAYLKNFPLDTLKVDRSFVTDVTNRESNRAITRAIVSLAHSLNLHVVAEGVETSQQLEYLRGLGCDAIQGFLISRPLPPDQLTELLDKGRQAASNPAASA